MEPVRFAICTMLSAFWDVKLCRQVTTFHRNPAASSFIQGVKLKSGSYFNLSNLFTKIYNMLYYTTNLYLRYVLEMMSVHFSALIDTFHRVPRNFS